jgi:RNA polymerase sigma-70 factor (ECF subfamily)
MDTIEHADRFLVARMLRGDEAAFTEFFDASFGPMVRFALPRVDGDADAAEEVVQRTLCRAVRKLSSYRGEAALMTWLFTICRHEIHDWFEQQRRIPPMVELAEDLPEIRAALDSLDALQQKETGRRVQLILDRLPGRYGDALEWKYIEGLSVAEIGERLGIATKAAESLLARARVAFRDAFSVVSGASANSGAGAEA